MRSASDERGSGSILVVGMTAVVLVVAAAAMVIAGYVVAAHRARSAADLGALSGAAAMASGSDPCSQAGRVVRRQGATVASCDQVGDQIDFVVTVRANVEVRVLVPGLPRQVSAVGYAGPTELASADGPSG